MLKGFSQWKRLLTIVLTVAMLFTNNYGVLAAFAEGEQPATNLELNAAVIVNNNDGEVLAGEKFQYRLQYTVPNLTDSQYTGALLAFTLPDYVVLTKDGNGNYEIDGPDFNSITYNELTGEYTVYFNSPLPMHATNTLTIGMKTENLVTPNGVTLNFNEDFVFQAQFQEGGESRTVEIPVAAGSIVTSAEADWQINKENATHTAEGLNYIKVGSGEDAKFEVTYRITVKDEAGGVDRLGRLGFDQYKVIDTLPTNLPAGGEAIEVKDVYLVRGTNGNVELTEGSDYSVVKEGDAPVSVIFNKPDKIKEGDSFGSNETSQYLKPGDTTNTTYQYTVVYPYNPYTTAADKAAITVHELVNTAVLDYKLVGMDPATDSDDAKAEIGAYEDNVVRANFKVKKFVQFKDHDPELLTSAAANKYNFTGGSAVKFTLYTDEACTNIAYNTRRVLMQGIGLDANGVATFEDIRQGVYYVKEVSEHGGWKNADVIRVEITPSVIDEDHNFTGYPEGADSFTAINTAQTINAVSFNKAGIDAYGKPAEHLAGATFTLTDKSDKTKVYTATSDANGTVRFNNIPDGIYKLEETQVSDALKELGYTVTTNVMESLEVKGGTVVYPKWSGVNSFRNESNKGTLKIVKEDAKNGAVKLTGATFDVYGPYATQAEANAEKNNPTEEKAATLTTIGTEGSATSGPLKQGYYVLVETKAPTNYTAGAPIVAHVEEQTEVTVTAKNNPQARVFFTKKGAENNASPVVQELAGAQFEIYDAAGNRLYGVKDSNGNYSDVSTSSDGREAVTIVTRLDSTGVSVSNSVTLSPGSYQYKETAVPAPFVAENEFVSFNVAQVAPSTDNGEWKTTQTKEINNYLEYGQIRIVKKTDNNRTDADALNEAEFGVYASEADAIADKNRLDTITTGTVHEYDRTVHGIGYTDAQLELNKTYYVKEIKAPDGYALNETVQSLTLTAADKQAEWECTNNCTVSIQITKIDSLDASIKLSGAKFGLYTAQNEDSLLEEKTTGSNGVVTFDNLKPNTTYYYKENAAPANYVITDGGFKEIQTGSTASNPITEDTVPNDRKGTLKIKKVKVDNSNFKDVTFKLFPVKDSTKDILADTNNLNGGTEKKTGTNGTASFTGLNPGTYWLVEKVPSGYETDRTSGPVSEGSSWSVVKVGTTEYFYKKVEVEAGQNVDGSSYYPQETMTIVNHPTKGKIQIKKFSANADGTASTTVIANVKFTVYSDEACTVAVTTLTTGSNGTKTSGFLPEGIYYLKETEVPSGYIKSDTVYEVAVEAGKTATTAVGGADLTKIVNNRKGSFTINKVAAYKVINGSADEVVRESLEGAKFALYKPLANDPADGANGLPANIEDSAIVATIDMTGASSGSVTNLDPGIYWLREIETPEGFETAGDSLVQVYNDGSVKFAEWTSGTAISNVTWEAKTNNTVTVDNESQNPRIRLIKHEYGDLTELLDGAKFEVYVEIPGKGVEMDVDGTTVSLSPVYNDGSFEKNASNDKLVLESGTVVIGSGVYQEGHALTPELEDGYTYYFKEIQAPDDYYYDPSDIWQVIEIPANATGEYRVYFANYPVMQVPGVKYGEDGKTALSGAVLAIFDNKTDADAMLKRLANDYNELTNPLTKATVTANQAAWNIDQLVESNAQGQFGFANLFPGKTYYIVEVVAPNNYQMDKDENGNYVYYKVTVSDPYLASAPFSEVYKCDTLVTANGKNVHTLSIVNYAKQKIWLDKKVKLSGMEYWVSGATFTIYPSKEEDYKIVPDTSVTLTPNTLGLSSNNLPGRFVSGFLPAGTYWLRETTVPEGFKEDPDRTVVNSAFGDDAKDFITYQGHRYYRVDLGRTEDNQWFMDHPVYNLAENGRFALTKINSVTNAKIKATFQIDLLVGNTVKDCGTIETSTSGYVLSNFLEPGLYRLTETSVVGNYTMLKDPIYVRIEEDKITDGTVTKDETVNGKTVQVYQPTPTVSATQSGTNDPVLNHSITVENAPLGQFYILKKGQWVTTKENLADVSFAVYKKVTDSFETDKAAADAAATNKEEGDQYPGAVKKIKTGNDGYAASGLLDAGDYWVIETGITGNKADEYRKDSYEPFIVTVVAGRTAKTNNTTEVVNISNFGKFQITKVDSVDGTAIKGVVFQILDQNGKSHGNMVDNGDGTYTSPRLSPDNTYTLKEITVPGSYDVNKNKTHGPYTVSANTLTVVGDAIENEHDKSLTVYKYEKKGDTETSTKINGARFNLYKTLDDARNNVNGIGEKTTANGKVAWNNLVDGTYYVRELSTTDQYLLQDPDNFTATDTNPAANIYKVTLSGKNGTSFDYAINVYNLRKGGFKLDKVISWMNGETEIALPGKKITFILYKDSVADANKITELTTNEEGKIEYLDKLKAGDYILVEKAATVEGVENAYNKPAELPDTDNDGNWIDANGYIHIRVLASQTNESFTGVNAVKNTANFGRFQLLKKTYTDNEQTESVGLNGAQYKLEVYNEATGEWVRVGESDIAVNDGEWSNGMYESGAMVPGKYRVTETKAPNPISNSTVEVEFTIDPTPIEFEIKAAATVQVTQYDGIYRNLVVKKITDANNGSQNLAGVTFELYMAKADATLGEVPYDGTFESLANYKDGDVIGTETTGANGVVTFRKLIAGKYLLVETAVPEGYQKRAVILEIKEALSYVDVEREYTMVNSSNKGKIKIRKEDTEGNLITKDTAQNAQFAIYALSDTELTTPLCTVSIDNTGYGLTSLLPAEAYYWVVETRAPEGYTLDERLLPLKKQVYVTGDQDPEINFDAVDEDAVDGYRDGVIFQNRVKSEVCFSEASLQKLVKLENGNEYADDIVVSGESLMYTDVTAIFKITNLTNPQVTNEIPYHKFIVTDETMKFMDKNGAVIEALANPTSDAYVMNKLTIGAATNRDPEKVVSAKIYEKVGNKAEPWQLVTEGAVTTGMQDIALSEGAVAFKVEYSNADVGFSAGDILVEVTFKQRPSDPNVPQVREVENKAELFWEDTSKNHLGQPDHQNNAVDEDHPQTGDVTDIAGVKFPVYDADLPKLALKVDKVNEPTSGRYYSGGTIDFETVGSVPMTSPEDLEHPVMSINLPPYTTLNTAKYPEELGGINGIRATLKNGTVCSFTVTKIIETNEKDQEYEKYVLDFGKDFILPVGEAIMLEYTANIATSVPDTVISIESYGFIGSGKQLPLTLENPTGRSYEQAESDGSTVITNDNGFDDGLESMGHEIDGDNLSYLRRPVDVELTRTDSRKIYKAVSVDRVNWLTDETPVVKPGDNYYYKLTLNNGGDPARRVRMIDILPFNGDTQEFRAMEGGTISARGTKLPSGICNEALNLYYEQVQLVDVAPQGGEGMSVRVYYYVEDASAITNVASRDWTAANRGNKTAIAELPMLTSNADAATVWAGWTTTAPADMRTVTAIGIEVEYDYTNGYSLGSGEEYSVVLTMRAPGYTAEQMNDYVDALIVNTTAGTVTGADAKDTDPVTAIDRVSSNVVKTKLYITTGAIGDYAFYDNNDNGIQDAGDIPARDIPVTLYRRLKTTTMTNEAEWEFVKTTYTNYNGRYMFEDLPCNYLIPGLDQTAEGFDPKDPANYIGSSYYEYQVEFGIPEGYAATIRYAGDNRAFDSNIDEYGKTEPVDLALTVGSDGKLVGEINPTIDAGYVKLVNLGDYVWIDYNKNGVQDESEIGLNGVTVNLYKLDSAEDTIEGKQPYRTTETYTKDSSDGYYLFELLPKGYYVVEFDLTTAEKETGYTKQFAFTVNDSGSDGADSDAAFVKDENDQIKYTEVIHLTEDDMTWDAGVTVYSALGGFVFDDQDYNDTQSIPTQVNDETTASGIPLPGTVVTLYKVNEDGSMDPEPIGQQTVGEDGRYFFDKLDAGRYKVHFDYPDKYIGVKEGVGDYLHDSETKFFDDSSLNSGFTDIIELPVDTADLTHDAGAYLVSTIGDYVWEDLDRDGIQDTDEAPVKDITVTLQQKLGDGEWTTIETTVTDENGLYLFEGIKSSDHYDVKYRVAFAIPLSVELTGDNIGENRAEDSNALPELDVEYGYFTDAIKPDYGEDDLTIDAGLYYKDGLCEVGDYVWYDDNKDGIQDETETGVEGIKVILEYCDSEDTWNEEAWEVVGTTETDANGKYIFRGLPAGRYRIAFGLNEPWIVTVPRVGDAALDSDAIRQNNEYYYTSAFFLNEGDSDMTWDAGIYQPETEPEKPEDPTIPDTGDHYNAAVWMAILLSSMTMFIILLNRFKKVTK